MRLTSFEQKTIKNLFLNIFQKGSIYLFGSRTDDAKKGGDIDLYIVLDESLSWDHIFTKKNEFRLKLEEKLGEQKIDIVISKDKNKNIEKIALQEGIKLDIDDIKTKKYLNECDKHQIRVIQAYNEVKHIFPLSARAYQNLSDYDIKNIDQYLFRFAKLQDTIGNRLFKTIIKEFEEDIDHLTLIDILNKLEKIGIINSAREWKNLRSSRNNISHQYDDEPEEMAEAINSIFAQKDILINIYNNIVEYFNKKILKDKNGTN